MTRSGWSRTRSLRNVNQERCGPSEKLSVCEACVRLGSIVWNVFSMQSGDSRTTLERVVVSNHADNFPRSIGGPHADNMDLYVIWLFFSKWICCRLGQHTRKKQRGFEGELEGWRVWESLGVREGERQKEREKERERRRERECVRE